MNARKQAAAQRESTPQPVDSTPTIGRGHPEYHFVEGLGSLHTQLGEVKAAIEMLTKSVDSTKSKVDDLVAWKNRILGGAVVIGAVITLITWGASKLSDYVEFKNPHAANTSQNAGSASENLSSAPRPKK